MAKRISKLMPYADLIKEHKNLVRILKFGTAYERRKLLQEQSAELTEYKKEYKQKSRRK